LVALVEAGSAAQTGFGIVLSHAKEQIAQLINSDDQLSH